MNDGPVVTNGLDVFLENPDLSGPVGLLANVGSLTRDGRTVLRALQEAGVRITTLFTPEHGWYGTAAPSEAVPNETWGDLSVVSLYTGEAELRLTPADVTGLSSLVIDIQDAGLRWYTYLAALQRILHVCGEAEVPVLLLDRPNPLGGIIVEGMPATRDYTSMVAPVPIPVRYALTFGEVAGWLNSDIEAELDVIPMRGWRRDMLYGMTGLVWSAPSPGLPTPGSTLAYAATCLIESLTVSEGRGTGLPFEQIGAPYVDAEALADMMNALELPGIVFRPAWFKPQASKFAGQACQGVRLHVMQPQIYEGYAVGLHLVATLRQMYPTEAGWIEFNGRNFFDALNGTAFIRQALERGTPVDEIIDACRDESRAFQATSAEFWLYE